MAPSPICMKAAQSLPTNTPSRVQAYSRSACPALLGINVESLNNFADPRVDDFTIKIVKPASAAEVPFCQVHKGFACQTRTNFCTRGTTRAIGHHDSQDLSLQVWMMPISWLSWQGNPPAACDVPISEAAAILQVDLTPNMNSDARPTFWGQLGLAAVPYLQCSERDTALTESKIAT